MPGRVPEPSTTAGSVVSSTAFPSNWIACANASLAVAESTDLHHPIHSVVRNTVIMIRDVIHAPEGSSDQVSG